VELNQLLESLRLDLLGSDGHPGSLALFAPELTLCVAIVAMLLVRVFDLSRWLDDILQRWLGIGFAFLFTLGGSLVALGLAAPWLHLNEGSGITDRVEIFTGMLVYDPLAIYLRAILLLFVALFAIFTKLSGIPDQEDGPDIYTLVLGATLGMCLMVSANHLLIIFLAVEMASVPSYALAGILKGRSISSEAALKYSIYGAGTAGVMLYGLSLLAGVLNSAHLPTMAVVLADKLDTFGSGEIMILVLAGLMVSVGLAFKLSAVPFHFWCPDVFEGAPAEINAFLSVASKAAALGLLVRVAFGIGHLPEALAAKIDKPAPHVAAAIAPGETPVALVSEDPHPSPQTKPPATVAAAKRPVNERLQPVCDFIARLVALLAVITCTFGNLAAYGQTNIKRLMAYSTIAHAGYMMMAVPAALAVASTSPQGVEYAIGGLLIYLGIYLFMNLGAFAIIAFLRNACGGSEEVDDYRGLIHSAPVYVLSMTVILFALVGLPPLAGFIGKFAIFAALIDSFGKTGEAYLLITVIIGGINTVVSLFYYLRVVRAMIIEPEPEERTPLAFGSSWFEGTYVVAVTIPTVVLFFSWSLLSEWATAAAQKL